MTRYALIGPTYPYRGGIAHYTTLLARHLRVDHEVLLISFGRQYPGWLFPGKSDKDPSERPLQTAAEYILDPLRPLTWRKTLHRLRAWQPDVVIMPWWHPYFALAWAVLGRGIKRLPASPTLIFICHNVLPHERNRLSHLWLPKMVRWVLGRGDRFIVHSQADGQILQQLVPWARYQVTPHPTYAELGGASADLAPLPVDLPDDRPLLLFCGLVRPYKGLDVLLEALAIAVQTRPLHLLVAGEFWQDGEVQYRQQIDRLRLHEAVTIWNQYLPDEWLAACIDRADVIVLPYRAATQSGIVQMAFGRGKPVITTDVGGLAEVVHHGRTGLVVPPENPSLLAQSILDYFAQGGAAVFAPHIQADARFSWDVLLKQIVNLLPEA